MSGIVTIDSSTMEKNKVGVPGKTPQTFFLPMVPGVVEHVIVGEDDEFYDKPSDINSIIARKHLTDKSKKKKYYPLFRGMVDTPITNESVLLIDDFAGENYYIGPLNSLNYPNFSPDLLNIDSSTNLGGDLKSSKKSKKNIPLNYKIIKGMKRLSTTRNKKLDDPNQNRKGEDGSIAKEETFGDMIFEGRYGNSIRIGFRDTYPLMILSNGRNVGSSTEQITDGTLMSMTTLGSLYDNFGQFTLASESPSLENPRKIGGGNPDEKGGFEGKFNYEYGNQDGTPILASQLFMNSDKITFNSRKDNITLSSFKNIDIGSGNNLTVNTKNYTSIESSNIYLGKQAQDENEPMVLGNQLKLIFDELLSIIESSKMTGCVAGLSGPLDPNTLSGIKNLKSKLNNFKSEYHFIEDNGTKT